MRAHIAELEAALIESSAAYTLPCAESIALWHPKTSSNHHEAVGATHSPKDPQLLNKSHLPRQHLGNDPAS